ncbi:hypothetical protein [Aeromonas salmonicida]
MPAPHQQWQLERHSPALGHLQFTPPSSGGGLDFEYQMIVVAHHRISAPPMVNSRDN